MLKKLLKYDLENTYKFLLVFYLLTIAFSIVTRVFSELEQTTFIMVLSKIFLGCTISMIASVLINTVMRNWVRFRQTMYGDESYLTHTLPIKKSTLYMSKFWLMIITFISSILICILSVFILVYSKEQFLLLKEILTGISEGINVSPIIYILSFVLLFIFEIITILQSGFIGIILGHKHNNKKIICSVVYGFLCYIIIQTIVMITLLLFALCKRNLLSIFTSNTMPMDMIMPLIILFNIVYLLIIIIINVIGKMSLTKGVNID